MRFITHNSYHLARHARLKRYVKNTSYADGPPFVLVYGSRYVTLSPTIPWNIVLFNTYVNIQYAACRKMWTHHHNTLHYPKVFWK